MCPGEIGRAGLWAEVAGQVSRAIGMEPYNSLKTDILLPE